MKILYVLLLFSVSAFGSDYYDDPEPQPPLTAPNTNINANLNGNLNKNTNRNTAVAKGGSVDSRIKNSQGQYQGANNKQGQSNKIDIQDNSVYEAQDRNPVSSAVAPNLVTGGDDICLGSSSAGAQGVGFGISFGTTTQDENCVMIKQTKLLSSLGLKNSAIARMCANEDMALAMKSDGYCGDPAVGGGAEDGIPLSLGGSERVTYDSDGDMWLGNKMQ